MEEELTIVGLACYFSICVARVWDCGDCGDGCERISCHWHGRIGGYRDGLNIHRGDVSGCAGRLGNAVPIVALRGSQY